MCHPVQSCMLFGLNVPRHGTYWRLDERLRRVEEGYPLQVGDRWAGIPNDIDAAFTYKDGKSWIPEMARDLSAS